MTGRGHWDRFGDDDNKEYAGGNRNRRRAVYEVVMGRSKRKDRNWGEWVLPNLYGNKVGGEGMITT